MTPEVQSALILVGTLVVWGVGAIIVAKYKLF